MLGEKIVWVALALFYLLLLSLSGLLAEDGDGAHEVYCLMKAYVEFSE